MIRSHRLTVLLLPLLLAVGCGTRPGNGPVHLTTADTTGGPVPGDWVLIHSLADPENLNPIISSDAGASEIFGYIYETLLQTDPFTLKTRAWIADSLPVIAPDHLSYEFHLRKDARFSDGKPVTGEDFIFCLKIIKNPMIENAAPLASYFERVDSATLVDGDPYRIRFVMREPYFLGDQVLGGLYALPHHIWDPKNISAGISFRDLNDTNLLKDTSEVGKKRTAAIEAMANAYEIPERSNDPSNGFLVGSGPYKVTIMNRNDRVVLARNENYWNKSDSLGAAWPDRLMWLTINNYNAALISLRSGDLDVMPRMEKIQFNRMKPQFGKFGLNPAVYDYPAYSYLGYNNDDSLFHDARVRRALAYAVNRKAIVDNIYFGMAQPVQSPIFYKRADYDTTLPTIPYNLDSARILLAEAGWKDTDGDGLLDKVIGGVKRPFKFEILMNTGNQARNQMGIIFASALKKVGIEASVNPLDWSLFLDRTKKGEFSAMIGGWVMGIEEGDLTQIWHSKSAVDGGSNHVHFRNRTVDSLLDAIASEFNPVRRAEMLREVQREIHNQQPYNFLVSEKFTGAVNGRFTDVSFFAPRPCYNAGWWWAPKRLQRFGGNAVLAER